MSQKIVFVGAGSYGFTFKLVVDILSYEALTESEFVFMDIDHDRLANLKTIVEAYFAKVGYKKTAVFTDQLEESLKGANFVINLVKIGRLEMSQMDMDVPKKYGLQQTIGDTCGLGGVFRGLRTMEYLIQLCKLIEKVSAKNAIVLNYTNPQAMSVMAASKVSNVPVIGLCHSVQGTSHMVANYIGVPYSEMDFEGAGINHMVWLTKLERKGEDLYPRFRQLAKERGIHNESGKDDDINARLGTTRLDMLNRVGYMVTESSDHFAEYVPYYLRTPETTAQYRLKIDKYKSNIARKEVGYQKLVERVKRGEGLPDAKRSQEYGSMIINSMVTDEACKIYANVMNTKIVTNLPEFSCVEVASLVDRNGVHACHFGELPTHLAALCTQSIHVHQLAVEAIVNRKRESVYWALMLDPLTHSVLTLDQIKEVADTLLDAQQQFFPGL
ncbi:MAG: alpha-galactosidase [Paenibacillaceae bacterium]|nr:alpha-galactosidase [Paenibacillaceae bacterium]